MNRHSSIWATLAVLAAGTIPAKPGMYRRYSQEPRDATVKSSRFYCNVNALSAEERLAHRRLTNKLIASRNRIVETERGYEFQYSPKSVSLAELAEWVAKESKCCPFFDFHIDVEEKGNLLCLRLTGEEGIKPFLLAEFAVPK